MTLTLQELSGFGALPRMVSRLEAPGSGTPSAGEIEQLAQLRPKVSEQELSALENEFKSAYRDLRRVAEQRRRCGQYTGTRKPEQHGYSAGCISEESTYSTASSRFSSLKDRLNRMREEMRKHRQESYEVDLRKYERSSEITYIKTPTGLIVPVRDQAALVASTAPAAEAQLVPDYGGRPSRGRLPWLVVGLAVAAAGIFYARRR